MAIMKPLMVFCLSIFTQLFWDFFGTIVRPKSWVQVFVKKFISNFMIYGYGIVTIVNVLCIIIIVIIIIIIIIIGILQRSNILVLYVTLYNEEVTLYKPL